MLFGAAGAAKGAPSGMYAEWTCQVGPMPEYPLFIQERQIVESTHFQP